MHLHFMAEFVTLLGGIMTMLGGIELDDSSATDQGATGKWRSVLVCVAHSARRCGGGRMPLPRKSQRLCGDVLVLDTRAKPLIIRDWTMRGAGQSGKRNDQTGKMVLHAADTILVD